jgi:hypothetical protein
MSLRCVGWVPGRNESFWTSPSHGPGLPDAKEGIYAVLKARSEDMTDRDGAF